MYKAKQLLDDGSELRWPHARRTFEVFLELGPDTPERARITYEAFSKAWNTSKLVRVARTVVRRGKSFITHLWVREGDVRKGDRVVMRPGDIAKTGSEKLTSAKSRAASGKREPAAKESAQAASAGAHELTDPAWDGYESRARRWGTASGATAHAATERFDVPGITKEYRKVLEKRFAQGTELAHTVYDMYVPKGGPPLTLMADSPKYNYRMNRILINQELDLTASKGAGAGTSWFHECGHYIDFNLIADPEAYFATTGKRPPQASDSPRFAEALAHDVRAYEAYVTERLHDNLEIVRRYIGEYLKYIIGGSSNGVQDIFSGVLGEPYPTKAGHVPFSHDNDYWNDGGNLPAEAFAHMFEAEFDPQKRTLMKEFFPSALPEFLRIMKELTQ